MITSTANEKVKKIIKLYSRRARNDSGLFLIEGHAELALAVSSGIELTAVYYCPVLVAEHNRTLIDRLDCDSVAVSRHVFEKIAYRGTVGGILAVARQQKRALAELRLSANPLILVADGIEKPGNVGAMLRTADACGADAVLLCRGPTDLYNPNIIRTSLGAVFSVPVVECAAEQALAFLQKQGIAVFAADPDAGNRYTDGALSGPAAIVIGSETSGLTKLWLEHASRLVCIPMRGQVNSLNASVAAALMLYEAVRQRHHAS